VKPLVRKTRCYAFSAAHVLASPQLSADENDRIFGKCANPNGHGHDYGVEVSVEGPVDPEKGEVAPNALLDEIFDEVVTARYSHGLLNEMPRFETAVPTAENIAQAIYEDLANRIEQRTHAKLAAVRVIETSNNDFVVRA
jgi:6-pyruvoyltetrahydropterin/6-carboxytetrahydropterin synthase